MREWTISDASSAADLLDGGGNFVDLCIDKDREAALVGEGGGFPSSGVFSRGLACGGMDAVPQKKGETDCEEARRSQGRRFLVSDESRI